MNVLVLDFDGVLCDSATETAVTAWRAGQHLWPEWSDAEPPAEWVTRFRQLRPVIETGYQAMALLRLIAAQVSDAEIHAAFPARARALLATTGRAEAELVRLFGATRDRWIAANLDDWLGRHRFYPGVTALLQRVCVSAEVFILTTKQRRFTDLLLRTAGVSLAPERIFGLETGRGKDEILLDLVREPRLRGARCWFVEDRLEALERVAARAELAEVRVCLALWGYCGPDDLRRAAANPRIRSLRLETFTDPAFPRTEA